MATSRSSAALEELRSRQAKEQRRRSMLLGAGAGAAVLVLGGGIGVTALMSHGSSSGGEVIPAAVKGATTAQKAPQSAKNPSDIPGVLAWKTTGWPGGDESAAAVPGALEHDHVPGPVKYTLVPPVGGRTMRFG